MAGYKEPGFQDRITAAAKAREDALNKLKSKPPVDPAVLAERVRLQAEAEERARLRAEARQAEKVAKAEAKAAAKLAEQAKIVPARPEPTEAERKAARDARYAARKARNSSR
jgi:hypothetical protein